MMRSVTCSHKYWNMPCVFREEKTRELYPFRILLAVLTLTVCVMLVGILNTPTYSQELIEARTQYEDALRKNQALQVELNAAEASPLTDEVPADTRG